MRKTANLFFVFSLLLCANITHCHNADNIQSIKELYPNQNWDELLYCRKGSELWGSKIHEYVVKTREIIPNHPKNNNSKEFAIQRKLYNLLKAYDAENSLRQRVTILKPRELKLSKDSKRYFFIMKRLYPFVDEKFSNIKRMYLGLNDFNFTLRFPNALSAPPREKYYTYQDVETLVNANPRISNKRTNMEQLCRDLGTLLALIHLEAKTDAYNIEVSLVRQSKDSPFCKVVIVDFDKIKNLTAIITAKEENTIISTLLTIMFKEAYYPLPTAKGFKHFREGYLVFAKHLDNKNNTDFYSSLAKKLFQQYIALWISEEVWPAINANKHLVRSARQT